jgi:hypothetical protein
LWSLETALDTATLVDAQQAGYKGVLCAPEQLERIDGRPADNSPVRINLTNNGQIIAFAFDRPISSRLAFGAKDNADKFTYEVILKQLAELLQGDTLLTWTDAETFGHHYKFADLFLHYLLTNSLPSQNIHPVSLTQALELIQLEDLPEARLRERTAWSCPHGDLVRWNGECPCFQTDASWK